MPNVESNKNGGEVGMILLLTVDDDIFHEDVVDDAVDIDVLIDYLTGDSFLLL